MNNTDGSSDDASPAIASDELIVVGVGSSAGGLEALQHLVTGLDATSKKAFIIAQHVSADHRSMMVDLLGRHSVLPVQQADHGQKLLGGQIYICPPGFHITVEAGDIVALQPVDEAIFVTKPSIDLLFKSLADVKGPRSIGVVLSGTGSDGTSGVGAIKDVDGFSIVQDPATAKYDGMPVSAINSGKIDLILAPDLIGPELQAIAPLADRPIPEFRSGENRDSYERILRLLKRDHSVNFSNYKDKTLSRRIMRRMIATKTEWIGEYADLLTEDPAELDQLFHDLLIGVTDFFRDTESFAELRAALGEYIEQKEEPFLRVWSIGCSTGEEPYSVAIMIAELLGDRLDNYRVQIFATDLNLRSIERARRGRYSAAEMSGIPQEIRERYFTFVDGHFEVVKRIKQMVVFSQHDVAQDPPFLRQDLVICRNVMIYFGNELQDALFPMYHYVLHPGALLFIGQAESVGPHQALWEEVSAGAKIFRSAASAPRTLPSLTRQRDFSWQPEQSEDRLRAAPRKRVEAEMGVAITTQLEKMLSPMVIVLNSADEMVYAHGESNPILQRQPGLTSDAVFSNVHPDVAVDLRTALHRLRAGEQISTTDFRRVKIGTDSFWVRLVLGETESAQLGALTVVYCQVEETLGAVVVEDAGSDQASSLLVEHEKQVSRMREQLAIVMEQLDSSNEQMQALNEELQSSNEELQSSNEELETTNEELQSTNEELQTAYAELRLAFDEKANQEDDLELASSRLREANELLELSEAVGGLGSWRWRPIDEEMVWSSGLHALLHTSEGTFTPSFDVLFARVDTEHRDMVREHIEQVLRGIEVPTLTFKMSIDLTVKWVTLTTAAQLGQYKNLVEVIGQLRDVTATHVAERRIAEQELLLADGEQQLKSLLEASVNGGFIYDYELGQGDFVNDSFTRLLGWELADLIEGARERDLERFHHPDDFDSYRRFVASLGALGTGESRTINHRIKHRDGHFVEVYTSGTVLAVGADGRASKLLGSFFVVNHFDA